VREKESEGREKERELREREREREGERDRKRGPSRIFSSSTSALDHLLTDGHSGAIGHG
jgi:hypothetical protein